jgi:hypothetical protein
LHKAEFILFYSSVLLVVLVVQVSVGSRVRQVLERGGGDGRVPSLITAAVESEASESYFSFHLDVSSMGHQAYNGLQSLLKSQTALGVLPSLPEGLQRSRPDQRAGTLLASNLGASMAR